MQIQELGDAVSTRRKLLGLRQAAVAHISAAVSAVGPQVREAMATHPGFVDIGKR